MPVPPPAPAGPRPPALRILHIADFGDDTRQQREVARAIAAAHGRTPFDLVVSAGDNIYPCGPDVALTGAEACAFAPDGSSVAPTYAPPADPRFALFERPLEPLLRRGRPLPVALALGNHDVAAWVGCGAWGISAERLSRTRACLEVAHRSPRWRMPGRHYVLDRGPARLIVVDSNLLRGDYGGFGIEAELDLVRSASSGCGARPCFIVAHHPPATAGGHRDDFTPASLARLSRMEEAAGGRIAAWLAGHDHDLQHLRSAGGADVFVSGNGSRGRPGETFEKVEPPGASLFYGSTSWGFGALEIGADGGWAYRFEDVRGAALYCCVAPPRGSCRPAACR